MSNHSSNADRTVFGLHSVRMLLERQPQRISRLSVQKERDDARMREVLQLAQQLGIAIEWRSLPELTALAGSERHQGVLAHVHATDALGEGALDALLDAASSAPLLLVLDGVQDPHNLGACLRTAEAAGVTAVIVPRDRAAGLSPTVRKVACGAAEIVPLIQVVNLARTLKWLRQRQVWIVGTDDQASQTLYEADLKGPLALVLGAEDAGLRRLTRESCDLLVSIPMQGVVESLNVSVATGITLFEAVRQRQSPEPTP
jgi:23S rRNA (guanosine2251-2'-O)-methyltransferase